MRKNSLILMIILLLTMGFSVQILNAQDNTDNDKQKEKRMQEAIEAQKKAMIEQQKSRTDFQLKEQQQLIDNAIEKAKANTGSEDQYMRIFRPGDRPFLGSTEPFLMYGHPMTGDSERTTWDFSKSVKESTFARDYTFDVEPTVNNVVMSVNGDCKSGEIKVKIIMPDGKTYSDILIDEFGNLNWRKSFSITDTENKDKTGAWKFAISASKATGYFKISLQTY